MPVLQAMMAVSSAVARAESGRLDEARHHLAQGSFTEARACLARVEGDHVEADPLLARAARLFDDAAQTLDGARYREATGR